MGQRYEINEWVQFELEGLDEGATQDEKDIDPRDVVTQWSNELENLQETFTGEANRVVRGWVEKNPKKAAQLIESDDYESDDDIAWNTWAGLVGHGVGFWENMSREDHESLEKAIKADKKLKKAFAQLGDAMDSAVYAAIEEVKVANPVARKLKSKLLR